MQIHRKHYAPDVSRMAGVFDDMISRKSAELSLTDALQMTYETMTSAVADKKYKNGVPLAYEAAGGFLRAGGVMGRVFGGCGGEEA